MEIHLQAEGVEDGEQRGEVGLSRRLHHIEILLHKVEADGLDGLLLRDAAPGTGDSREVTLGHKDFLAIFDGQHLIIMILQHDDGLELGLVALLHVFRLAHDLLRLSGIEVGILEKPHTEHQE